MEKLPSERTPNKLDKDKVSSIRLSLIFNLPDFIDLEYLKNRFKECELDDIEVFEKRELEGLISVPVDKLDIKSAVREAKNKIAVPIKDAIVSSGFANKIKEEVRKNELLNLS